MSADRETTRVVRSWLEEGVTSLPERVLDAVLDQVPTTRQRRPLWPVGRMFHMSTYTRLAAGLAAVLVIAVGAVTLSPLLNSATQPATPTPTASPSPGASGEVVILEPGTYTTKHFRPAITYTVPLGWALMGDGPNNFTIAPAAFTSAGVTVCRNPRPGDKEAKPVTGVETDARSLATWFAGRPEVGVISGPTDWSQGGLQGYWFDLRGVTGGAEVNLIGHAGDGSGCGTNIYPDQRVRLGFLDAPDATLLVYVWDTFGGETYIEAATRVIESYTFDVP